MPFLSTDYVFPVMSGNRQPDGAPGMDVKSVFGTAFWVADDVFITAAHVLREALEQDVCAIGRLTDQRRWKLWSITAHEFHPDIDLALLRVANLARAAPPLWRFDELMMLDAVQAVGYPYALELDNRTINMRAFRGYVSAPTTSYRFTAKPRVYELSMPVPRGLSGAPLWSDEGRPTVVGIALASSVVEVPIVEITESDGDGHYMKVEAYHLGMALQSSELRSLHSDLLGSTFGAFVEKRQLIAPSLPRADRSAMSMAESEITAAELAAMKGRIAAATPGPWTSYIEGRDHTSADSFIQTATQDIYISADDYASGGGHFCADQDFIAHARQDMPKLIAEVERLQRLIKSK